MITAIISHEVKDFDTWLKGFEDHAPTRGEAGCLGCRVFTEANDRNKVTIEFRWNNLDAFKKFAESDDLKETMKRFGVVSQPEIHILDEISNYIS